MFNLFRERFILWTLVCIIPLFIGVWFLTRDTLPGKIRIAAGYKGGLYYKLAEALAKELRKRSKRKVKIITSTGSMENRKLLLEQKVELAILQSSPTSMAKLTALIPLYQEATMVLVRQKSKIQKITDLQGRKVILGPLGSGMRASAKRLLQHYNIQTLQGSHSKEYFTALSQDTSLEAAIVTTGLINQDLEKLVQDNNLRILPIKDARAIALKDLHLSPFTIPGGLFSGQPRLPQQNIETIATTALLVSRLNTSPTLVQTTLDALYKSDVRLKIPVLIPAGIAKKWDALALHPATLNYFNPYGGLSILADFMESLSALKELLVAFAAALFLVYSRWQKLKEKERQQEIGLLKDRLDVFLEKTLEIEKSQMLTEDTSKLNHYLDEVTRIKLQALEELAHEELRGDSHFAIFLTQCANLIRKIQSKLHYYRDQEPEEPKTGSSFISSIIRKIF
ncbi:MAG: TAXI family TRAP transporter solute-binding subunit [Spirochaetota bacterium]